MLKRPQTHSLAHPEIAVFICYYIVTYLLKARTVEAEKQPLLGNARMQQ
jgi:hypothetical protein